MPKLFIVYLGGKLAENRIGEDHEVVLVVAESQMGAMSKAKSKWQGHGKAHVDRILAIETIDNFDIILKPNQNNVDNILTEEKNDWS